MSNDAPKGFLSPEREAELVERAQAGDPFAVNEILDAHEPIIEAAVHDLHESIRPQVRDAAWRGLHDAWQRFDPERGRFGAFARTVVRRRVADALRELAGDDNATWLDDDTGPEAPGETFHDVTEDPATLPGEPRATDAELDGPEAAEHRDQLQRQARLIVLILEQNPTLLTPRQAGVVKATLRGHTPEFIADALDARKDSIERSLQRAAEKLRGHLEQVADAGGYRDPFREVEAEGEPEGRYVDPFQQVQGGSQ